MEALFVSGFRHLPYAYLRAIRVRVYYPDSPDSYEVERTATAEVEEVNLRYSRRARDLILRSDADTWAALMAVSGAGERRQVLLASARQFERESSEMLGIRRCRHCAIRISRESSAPANWEAGDCDKCAARCAEERS